MNPLATIRTLPSRDNPSRRGRVARNPRQPHSDASGERNPSLPCPTAGAHIIELPTLGRQARPTTHPRHPGAPHPPSRPIKPFTKLLDAHGVAELLGVPHTWVLAQARASAIPHHRLGHYVRFDPDDIAQWLTEGRVEPKIRRL